jgi:hypothetical protein
MYTQSVHLRKLLSICALSRPGSLGRNTVDPKALLKAQWVLRLYRLRRDASRTPQGGAAAASPSPVFW